MDVVVHRRVEDRVARASEEAAQERGPERGLGADTRLPRPRGETAGRHAAAQESTPDRARQEADGETHCRRDEDRVDPAVKPRIVADDVIKRLEIHGDLSPGERDERQMPGCEALGQEPGAEVEGCEWQALRPQAALGRARRPQRTVGPCSTHERVVLWVFDRVNGEVDVEVRPVDMMRMRKLDVQELSDRGVAEPGELAKGQEMLPVANEQPEAVSGNIPYFNWQSAPSRVALGRIAPDPPPWARFSVP